MPECRKWHFQASRCQDFLGTHASWSPYCGGHRETCAYARIQLNALSIETLAKHQLKEDHLLVRNGVWLQERVHESRQWIVTYGKKLIVNKKIIIKIKRSDIKDKKKSDIWRAPYPPFQFHVDTILLKITYCKWIWISPSDLFLLLLLLSLLFSVLLFFFFFSYQLCLQWWVTYIVFCFAFYFFSFISCVSSDG